MIVNLITIKAINVPTHIKKADSLQTSLQTSKDAKNTDTDKSVCNKSFDKFLKVSQPVQATYRNHTAHKR